MIRNGEMMRSEVKWPRPMGRKGKTYNALTVARQLLLPVALALLLLLKLVLLVRFHFFAGDVGICGLPVSLVPAIASVLIHQCARIHHQVRGHADWKRRRYRRGNTYSVAIPCLHSGPMTNAVRRAERAAM